MRFESEDANMRSGNLGLRHPIVLASALSVLLVSGCGGGKSWETVYAAKGTVTLKGKPVKDAEIAFFPTDPEFPESVRPWAKTNENGEFVVSTYGRDDGAPAGTYRATVVRHEIVVSKGAMGTKPNDLPKKYASKETTDWTVEIGTQETVIPALELQ
jgi:hypothetical protein